MNFLFFDTETTGLVKNWDISSDDRNPRLVQLGMILCDYTGRPINTYSSIVKPEGFSIPQEVADCSHGISNEMALKYGRSISIVMNEFVQMYQRADVVIAHNLKFDHVIVKHEMHRLVDCLPCVKETFCTMLNSTNVCNIPKKSGGYKWPKLYEAYYHFFHEELKNAHDALADVLACKRIFFEGLMAHKGYLIRANPDNSIITNNADGTIDFEVRKNLAVGLPQQGSCDNHIDLPVGMVQTA